MKAPEDFLHNDEIERILYTHMSRGRWLALPEIYSLIEQHAELTDADRRPAVAGSRDLRWRRNVRNFLQSRKNRGDLEWDGDGRYRLSEVADRASLEVGWVYRRQELHDRFGGQRYGGISTPTDYPIVMLISGEEGAAFGYNDEQLEDGTLIYFGEGQTGPMQFTRGNLAVRDHGEAGEELHVFRKIREGYVRYVGEYVYAGHEIRSGVRDRDGSERDAIAFRLVPLEQLEADEQSGDEVEGVSPDDLEALRAAALEGPTEGASLAEARRTVWRRSRAVRRYVLVRSNGICEGCGETAPFLRPDGRPYLEPHHTRRLSDSGPDHPRWVIALCPTCHRRVHYGLDGPSYNDQLEAKLALLEPDSSARTD